VFLLTIHKVLIFQIIYFYCYTIYLKGSTHKEIGALAKNYERLSTLYSLLLKSKPFYNTRIDLYYITTHEDFVYIHCMLMYFTCQLLYEKRLITLYCYMHHDQIVRYKIVILTDILIIGILQDSTNADGDITIYQ
jgi:hypothetical protein